MTIRNELRKYAEECIAGKIPSCKKHKQSCQRFLNDLQKRNWEYKWDEAQAQKIVTWFSYLRHSKGVLAGQPIILTTSQKFFICQLYGWRHKKTGYKRFTIAFKEIGRKNAKTQEQAGCLLYEIAIESTAAGEIYDTYCAGTKREQSKYVFDECKYMLRGSPLARKFKITRDYIEHIKTGSTIKALSKDDRKTGDGSNPAVLVLDEYHQHQTTEFYDLGLGGNAKQSLMIIITTAGVDLNSPCYQQEYKYCSNILNPDIDVENDRYLIDIREADEGDDPASDIALQKSNPIRMSYPEGRQKIYDALKIAQDIPEKMIAFKTKILNLWVQAKNSGYMNMAKWKKCEKKKIAYAINGMSVYVGFDMSAKIDLTSVAFIIPVELDGTVKYICFSHSFVPNREKLIERVAVDHAPYDVWEEQGYITVTDTPIVDQQAVIDYVLDFCKQRDLKIECLCFDPANASKMMMDLSNEGYDVEEVFQSQRSLNEATAGFREQVYCENIIYISNPVLNFAMANAVIRQKDGLIKIDKDATHQRIDPVDAMLCAYKLAMYHRFDSGFLEDEWLNETEW